MVANDSLPLAEPFAGAAPRVGAVERERVLGRVLGQLFGDRSTTTLGRYRLERPLGSGGFGVVYRAHDPQMGRDVAIKILQAGGDGHAGMDRITRLLREARALACLRHPNVVEILDVGIDRSRPYLVMELVDGGPLTPPTEPRAPWRKELACMLGAARGLAAIHDAGLVHGDIKPANVLIGPGTRVRLGDMGLARAAAATTAGTQGPQLGGQTESNPIIAGTPRYMAPEQRRGNRADACSDQYAWCVMVWERLVGALPCTHPHWPSLRQTGPARLGRILRRGLADDPQRRWPSMHALIVETERLLRPPRGPWLAAGSLCALGLLASTARPVGAAARDCLALGQRREPPTRLAQTDATVEAAIAAHTAAWDRALMQSCRARATRSAGQAQCLEHSRAEREALLRSTAADPTVAASALVVALQRLPPPALCLQERSASPGRAGVSSPTRQRTAVVDRGRALIRLGRYDRAQGVLDSLLDAADRPDTHTIDALVLRGEAHGYQGHFEPAVVDLERAYVLARGLGDDWHQAVAATRLAWTAGHGLHQPERGDRWLRHAAAAIDRLPDPRSRRRALTLTRARLASTRGDLGTAIEHAEALLHALPAPLRGRPAEAELYTVLGGAQQQAGRLQQARRSLRRALSIEQAAFGEDHPRLSSLHYNLAVAMLRDGGQDQALPHADRAVALARTRGDDGMLATALELSGRALYMLGHIERAEQRFEQALQTALRHDPVGLAAFASHTALTNVAVQRGAPQRADHHARRALAIAEAVFGPDHPQYAGALSNLARTHAARDQVAEALASYDRAIEIWSAAPSSGWAAMHGLLDAADVLLRSTRHDSAALERARRYIHRAQRLANAHDVPAPMLRRLQQQQDALGVAMER